MRRRFKPETLAVLKAIDSLCTDSEGCGATIDELARLSSTSIKRVRAVFCSYTVSLGVHDGVHDGIHRRCVQPGCSNNPGRARKLIADQNTLCPVCFSSKVPLLNHGPYCDQCHGIDQLYSSFADLYLDDKGQVLTRRLEEDRQISEVCAQLRRRRAAQ